MSEQMTRRAALGLVARTEQRIGEVERVANDIDRAVRDHRKVMASALTLLDVQIARSVGIANRGWRGRWAWLLRGK